MGCYRWTVSHSECFQTASPELMRCSHIHSSDIEDDDDAASQAGT
jgi:hypothetical protein